MMGEFGRFRDIDLVFLRQKQVTSASGDQTWHCPVPGVLQKQPAQIRGFHISREPAVTGPGEARLS